jgi:hypothetical protein
MDLPVVEKPVPAILLNCDNKTVIFKVNNSKDNAKPSRHVKRCLKSVRKLRNSRVITVTYIQTDKTWQIPLPRDYHAMCTQFIEGDGFETHRCYTIVVTQLL